MRRLSWMAMVWLLALTATTSAFAQDSHADCDWKFSDNQPWRRSCHLRVSQEIREVMRIEVGMIAGGTLGVVGPVDSQMNVGNDVSVRIIYGRKVPLGFQLELGGAVTLWTAEKIYRPQVHYRIGFLGAPVPWFTVGAILNSWGLPIIGVPAPVQSGAGVSLIVDTDVALHKRFAPSIDTYIGWAFSADGVDKFTPNNVDIELAIRIPIN